MKIKIMATDVIEEFVNKDYNPLIIEMEYHPEITILKEIRDKIGAPISGITFKKYYNTGEFRFYNNSLPYIIKKNGKIEFEPSIDDTLISEFVETHKINNNTIEIEYGFPQAGGPDLIDWRNLWDIAWEAIQVISTIGGAIGLLDFIKTKFSDKKPIPHEMMECLYKREYWNHNELAEKLDIKPEEAKNILKVFGYYWDKSKKIYVIDKEKKKDIQKTIYKIKHLSE